ncbi:hypothetical protein F4703DRAFT_1913643 [Phycomyces blakesleeanus]
MPSPSVTDIDLLRNNIEFASISQFFHTFHSAFTPWPATTPSGADESFLIYNKYNSAESSRFSTEDLEHMILDVTQRHRFEELIVRMLRLLTRNRFITHETWQMYFAREWDRRISEVPNPFHTDNYEATQEIRNFFTFPLDTKVHLLHVLCEWYFEDPERLREHLSGDEDEDEEAQWRVDPIGCDSKGNIFYLFDDNRLYQQSIHKPKTKPHSAIKKAQARKGTRHSARNADLSQIETPTVEEIWMPWRLVCQTSSDWEMFPSRYSNSTHIDEKKFYRALIEDVIPKVLPVLLEHEKELKKQEALLHRKRSSRLMVRELASLVPSSTDIDLTEKRASRREENARRREEAEKESAAKAREERLLDRERRLHEREMARLEQDGKTDSLDLATKAAAVERAGVSTDKKNNNKNYNNNNSNSNSKKRKRTKAQEKEEESNWTFDCVCGLSGQNVDDGSPMIACERCGVWQHIQCLRKSMQINKYMKSLDNYEFICQDCKRPPPFKSEIPQKDQIMTEQQPNPVFISTLQPVTQPSSSQPPQPPLPLPLPTVTSQTVLPPAEAHIETAPTVVPSETPTVIPSETPTVAAPESLAPLAEAPVETQTLKDTLINVAQDTTVQVPLYPTVDSTTIQPLSTQQPSPQNQLNYNA